LHREFLKIKKAFIPLKRDQGHSAVPPLLMQKRILSKPLTPHLRRIFPAELKGQVQKGLPRLASTACFLGARGLFYYSLSLFFTVSMIPRKSRLCQGEREIS